MQIKLYLPAILLFTVSVSFGQSGCVAFFEYTGTVSQDSLQIEKVGLATSRFLSGVSKENAEDAFDEVQVADDTFKQGMSSQLSSIFCRGPAEMIDLFFKGSKKSYPVILYQKGA